MNYIEWVYRGTKNDIKTKPAQDVMADMKGAYLLSIAPGGSPTIRLQRCEIINSAVCPPDKVVHPVEATISMVMPFLDFDFTLPAGRPEPSPDFILTQREVAVNGAIHFMKVSFYISCTCRF
jgi:hypothetical protein